MTKQTKPPSERWLTIVFPQVQTVWAQPHSTSRVVFSTVSFSDQVEMLRVWGVKQQTLRRSYYKTSKSMGCVEAKVWHTLIVGLHWENYCVTLDQSHFKFWGGLFTKHPSLGHVEDNQDFRHLLKVGTFQTLFNVHRGRFLNVQIVALNASNHILGFLIIISST